MKLGLVTYNIAKDWDIDTIIKNCAETGFEAVELRTTHAHGVEPDLDAQARAQVKKAFAESPVKLLSLGTTCEYHSPDSDELQRQIGLTEQFLQLAADVGARGIKVRPNAFPEGVSREATIKQIGESLRACGQKAAELGIEIWLEVHGRGTSHPPYVRQMMEIADHPQVGVCWNSNITDLDESGSIDRHFEMLKPWIRNVHITELWSEYPWRRLFQLLREAGYSGYCCCEVAGSPEPVRFMRYYKALFDCLSSCC